MTLDKDLYLKIEQKKAVVGIIGLGYVGLPLALCFAEKGFKSIGFDIDTKKTTALMRGESYIKHIPAERIQKAIKSGLFSAPAGFSSAGECDAILIAVPSVRFLSHSSSNYIPTWRKVRAVR